MTTSTIASDERLERPVGVREARAGVHVGRFGLGTAGVIALLVSAWGGIIPYVGPVFNYSADGSASWHWNLAHTVLALVPGALGVLLGLFVIAESRGITVGRGRLSLAMAGTLLMICGAWFAIGFLAWPVISDSGPYFVATTHLRVLADEVGYGIGVGLILVFCGAYVVGWASRHQPKASVLPETTAGTVARGGTMADRPAAADRPLTTDRPMETGRTVDTGRPMATDRTVDSGRPVESASDRPIEAGGPVESDRPVGRGI
jgi:hypothetical protein